MSGDHAPRRARARTAGVCAAIAAGLAMLASAAAGLAGLDGRLAAMAQAERTPAADPAARVSGHLDRDCPARGRQL